MQKPLIQKDDIPAKFIDPITLQPMSDPIVLPSKYIVDRTTSILLAI